MRAWKILVSQFSGYYLAISGVLTIVFGILGAGGFFETLGLPPIVRTYLNIAAALLAVAVGILVVASGIYRFRMKRTTYHYPGHHYLSHCNRADIKEIVAVASDVFTGATSLEETENLHNFDPNIFTAIRERDHKLVGYICIIRLSEAGVTAIEQDKFRVRGVPELYLKNDEDWLDNDLYVGAIWGIDAKARGCALYATQGILRALSPRRVFARAATDDGLRVLNSYGFSPIRSHRDKVGEIFVWHAPR